MSSALKNPPVFHMLVQVKFNQLPLIEKKIDLIKEQFRKYGFPDISHEIQSEINISDNDHPSHGFKVEQRQVDAWSFIDFDKQTGYVLTDNFIIFHTTAYEDFEHARSKVIKGLSIIHETLTIDYIARIGMRFLNSICPEEGRKLTDYVQENTLGSQISVLGEKGFVKQQSLSESIFNYGSEFCISRVVTGRVENSPPLMPQDLLSLIEQLELKKNFTKLSGEIAIVDIDCSQTDRVKMDLSQFERSLDELHSNARAVFESTIKLQMVQ